MAEHYFVLNLFKIEFPESFFFFARFFFMHIYVILKINAYNLWCEDANSRIYIVNCFEWLISKKMFPAGYEKLHARLSIEKCWETQTSAMMQSIILFCMLRHWRSGSKRRPPQQRRERFREFFRHNCSTHIAVANYLIVSQITKPSKTISIRNKQRKDIVHVSL